MEQSEKQIASTSIHGSEIIALGVGLVGGTVVGAVVPTGSWPEGIWVIFAAFIAAAVAIFQVRQNARNADLSKQLEWRLQQKRVVGILLAELRAAITQCHFVVKNTDAIKNGYEKQVQLLERYIKQWTDENWGGKGLEFPKHKTHATYLPNAHFNYFKEHTNAVEYLPVEITVELCIVKDFMDFYAKKREEQLDIHVIAGTVDNTVEALATLEERLLTFHKRVEEFRVLIEN